ncbi:UNVERIFIED_CONTAM: hypothetical protein FKN15_060826 [Acipenser sinensis]
MVEFLVEHGANVNQPDNEGWTPLHAAASCGFTEIAGFLIKKGARVEVVNSEGELPLDVAQESAMERLLQAEIKKQGDSLPSPPPPRIACIDENLEMVEFLVEHGANVNQPDNEGWTPLHAAASCGFTEIAGFLIKKGARVEVVNSEGELPLDVAQESAMERLLQAEIKKQGVDVELARQEEKRLMLQDAQHWVNQGKVTVSRHPKTGATDLHVAAAKGYLEVIK